ncbi:hypothetical protein [Dinghuibacter silviterrae]|uniref:Uncharacterized protein n=1 Tax=Dinghuibacter silviterrae TaxID=1539049 RepID=A0A4R8DPV8_9BACT|nr:hypothetical protein [Dinghuibacter silviterrae]TDW99444.1 hypothetical protein EDB95_0454 [Dinghuibacter silviterrae]
MDPHASSHLDTLKDIRNMMERSGRFISLSGWSGIAAGSWALAGAYLASREFRYLRGGEIDWTVGLAHLRARLMVMGLCIFVGALASAFAFTYARSRKQGVPIWGSAARRLLWNTMLPMLAGGVLVLRLLYLELGGLVAPVCLLFYGLALVNGSKYTLGEVRYLGYALILLGAINCWVPGYGLYFWAVGFGVLHIVYGIWMWRKYEKPDR